LHVDAFGALEQGELAVLPVCAIRPGCQPLRGGIEKGLVTVDEGPMLFGSEPRCHGTQVGARAAAEVHDRQGTPVMEVLGERPFSLAVARARIRPLAQVEPLRAEACQWATSAMTSATMRAVSCQRGSFCPADHAAWAMRWRSSQSSRMRRMARVSARSSPGGT